MGVVNMIHIGLGGSEFDGVGPARPVLDPELSSMLGRRFRESLNRCPQHFMEKIEIEGHPLLRFEWVSLHLTAGLVMLRSGDPDPDVYCLLLNGLEDPEDMVAIERHCRVLHEHWDQVANGPRPVAVAGYTSVSRMRDPAVPTVLGAFANAYFTQFGTSG